jgi:asparagine synthase (glutamine-hydrolysing)
MSAIAGIYHLNGEPISPDYSAGLMKVLEQYPANDIQTLKMENIFLGCHAQWITAESVGEKLPYYDHNRKLAITADAIIDNRGELFEKLQVEKSLRKTMSDSELILLSYFKWEEESPKHLVGEYAFMIWDEKKQKLFGARDFSGARTFYYYFDHQHFAFCTTIQPLLSLPYIDKELNENWIAEYLAFPGMNDTIDTTITPYTRIQQLSPSNSITIEAGKKKITRYCKLSNINPLHLKSNQEYEEAFRDVFQIAVDSRIRTHKNVGAHLSGGLDSGSVVSFAARSLEKENKGLQTFSYIPPNDFVDWTPRSVIANEKPLIESTVKFVGNINDHYLDFPGISPLSEVSDLIELMEMPYKFFANSIWIKGIFEQASQQGVGVLLNGGRGNLSISWGPALNYYAILLRKFRWIRLFNELNQYSKNVGGNRLRRIPSLSRMAFPSINKVLPTEEEYQFPMLINMELAKRSRVFEKFKDHGIDVNEPSYERDIYKERKKHFDEVYTWNTTGTVNTKLSLRYSLWKRDPTNDIRVIRFCLAVPEEQFVQNGLGRALIRRSTKNYLPDDIRLNQRTRGIQGADCIHRMLPQWGSFINELEHLTKDSAVSQFINVNTVNSAISKVKQSPLHEYSFNPEFTVLIRSLIFSRFLRNFT